MERFYIGQSAQRARTVTGEDIRQFAQITGDSNPVHLDADYAAGTRFGGCIAHGVLSAGLVSAVLGMDLPGPGSIYLGQQLKFLRPVYPGDTVTARVTITRLDGEKRRAVLDTVCINQKGEQVLAGEATMLLPPEE